MAFKTYGNDNQFYGFIKGRGEKNQGAGRSRTLTLPRNMAKQTMPDGKGWHPSKKHITPNMEVNT